jgi:ribonuclease HI
VRLANGAIVRESAAAEPWTTGARMALRALIEGLKLFEPRQPLTLYADDRTAVMTLKEWGPAWQRNGWRLTGKKGRPADLELVQDALALYRARVNARVEWVPPDKNWTWPRYARALASWHRYAAWEDGEPGEVG